jgi:hypothetical protein
MKKTFKSKVEMVIIVPVIVLLLITGAFTIVNRIWPAVIAISLVSLFILYLYLQTVYELTEDAKLKIKSGFLYHQEIYVNSIKKIRQTRNHLASPALSTDRLEILYNRYGRVLISPDEKSEFINQLRRLNPRITVG